jgi:beta-galactosidase/beta-glucuronidase
MKIILSVVLSCCLWSYGAPRVDAAVVTVEKNESGWQLLVDGEPFIIKGVCYTPAKVGESPDNLSMRDWMIVDDNADGTIDTAYQSWVDYDRNNKQDQDEPTVGDFQLIKEMGANTVRLYHHASANPQIQSLSQNNPLFSHAPNKKLLRDLHENYGLWFVMGDFLGAYTIGSGATWEKGTDYTDPIQRKNMMRSVEELVNNFKDEPYILFWTIGNENNRADVSRTNAQFHPEEYAKFVNEVAQRIHQLDPNHPVALINGETAMLDVYRRYAPDIDIIGINTYFYFPGGFGSLWQDIALAYDKPVIVEYKSAHPVIQGGSLDEIIDYRLHVESWRDIERHTAGKSQPGNAIGGFKFQWLDNWWTDWDPGFQNLSKDGWHGEYHGIASQGDGHHSLFIRQLRHVYYAYQELWKE